MFFHKDKMTFDRKLTDAEKQIIRNVVNGSKVIACDRPVTEREALLINDFLDGKRFMSRYHAGQKKEKVVKEKKVRDSRKVGFVKTGVFI
jgi:hypothetical protein